MDINNLLNDIDYSCGRYHACDIGFVSIAKGAIGSLGEITDAYETVLLVADENTYQAAGEKTIAALSGKKLRTVIFSGRTVLIPNEEAIERVSAQLNGVDLIIGIGSGVIQDLCKYVSHSHGIPYYIVATAPSMDGYASTGAAMILPGMDLAAMYPYLGDQWHPDKNGELTPKDVLPGSHRSVWWRCDRGHAWQASIKSRTQGAGCPVCAGRVVNSGENDLKSYSRELAEQWNWEKNGTLRPDQVSVFCNRRVWWKCGKQHEWQAKISDRVTKRSDCPYCTNRRVLTGFNDLKTVEPLVAAQWHPDRNAPLEPSMVLPGSTKRVWWRCGEGHEWKAVIYSRTGTQKCGCPVCAGKQPRTYR